MIVNGKDLLKLRVVDPMLSGKYHKEIGNGSLVSHGLAEAGYDVRVAQDLFFHPFSRFKLASTIECFYMPKDLVAIVHDKSSWARRGLAVQNTVIEPGWRGWLTLEINYHGWRPLRIPKGTGIAQILFHELRNPSSYRGKYQDQGRDPQPAK